ncbi:MAG: hypothetical protein NW214_06535 [Pseudanabaenaceae cyanobacterium bins.39]|nr:hypothetical protein [Pseudanabaenaceae cyanobacterium bins.39]
MSSKSLKSKPKLEFVIYALIGIVAFTSSSQLDNNPHIQIYITLLATKLGIALVYALGKMRQN